MSMTVTYAQHLGSARGTAMAAFTAPASDAMAIDWNPAGLIRVNDWELSVSGFSTISSSSPTTSFHSAALARRFGADHAAAFRISPGHALEFLVPSTIVVGDSSNPLVTTFDKRINYYERYSLGYSFRPVEDISFGVDARFLEEQITDTKYSVDTNFVIRSGIVDYRGSSWSVDLGGVWNIGSNLTAGLVVENLIHIVEQSIPEDAEAVSIRTPKILRGGISFRGPGNTEFAFEGDTERGIRAGGEWHPFPVLAVRGGLYASGVDGLHAEAFAVGLGGTVGIFGIDLSYLHFVSGTSRRGSGSYDEFKNAGVSNLEFNAFTGDRIALTTVVRLGRTHQPLARIEYVEMLSDVYSSSQMVYAYRPVAKARVRNISQQALDAKVSFFVRDVMDAPTEAKPRTILPGEVAEIPLFAIFNNAIRTIPSLVIREGDVYVTASPLEEYDDRFQTHVVFRGRNDWNGDVTMLRYFATTDDPDVLQFSRSALNRSRDLLDTIPAGLQAMARARIVFDAFSGMVQYVNDPKKSQDHVQYPSETLSLKSGDCEDMTVCYAALLASMGFSVAFIDVVPPSTPEQSHVYMMFDSGIPGMDAAAISDNSKRYVIRKNTQGVETAWIPVETTDIRNGFEEAWNSGAAQYFQGAEVDLGIVHGWMKVVDLEPIY
jgi:hypothetical protein